MAKHCASNERIKRKYLTFLQEAKRYDEATVDGVAMAIHRFDEHAHYRDFKTFHFEQAVAFKRHLTEQRSARSGERLSKATVYATLRALRSFFQWLACQPGYKSRLQYPDAEYFNLSEKDIRVATARRELPVPTVEQVLHVLRTARIVTELDRRNQALIAFTLLTGARDSALASMKLKHVDLGKGFVSQDAREVKTKFSKTFVTHFFPVGEEALRIVEEWIDYLRVELLWGNDDPLFPATKMALGPDRRFAAAGLDRAHWSSASPIREIFRTSFQRAGFQYFNPHSFRNMLVRLGQQLCQTPEQFKAWSQNLGHEKVLTTFTSYGMVQPSRQGEILRELRSPQGIDTAKTDLLLDVLVERMRARSQPSR